MRTRLTACGVMAAVLAYGAVSDMATAGDAIVVRTEGLDGLLVDEKDQALRNALHLLDERLGELPAELGEADMPGPLLQMAARMLLSPMTLRIGSLDQAPNDGPPFYASLAIEAENAQEADHQAEALLQMLQGMSGQQGGPVAGREGMTSFDLDGVPLLFGTGEVDGRPALIAALNTDDVAAPAEFETGLPDGVDPAMTILFDGEQLRPLIDMAMQHAPPMERGMVEMQLGMMGLTGEHPLKVTAAVGYSDVLSHTVIRLDNYLTNPDFSAMMVREPITREILQRVPADATYVQLGRAKLSALGDAMQAMFEMVPPEERQGMEDPFAMIEQEIGIHPKRDLLDHLGDSFGSYMSDTTGGGGLLSTVIFFSVANEEALEATLEELRAMVNEQGRLHAQGYVNLQRRTVAGHDMVTLSFPGIPIPLEISYALEDGYFTVAATPQALVSALAHVKDGGDGLYENERFTEVAGDRLDDSQYIEFMDTPRLLAAGYGFTSLITSALSNGLQSPRGGRDVGSLLPSYRDLADGAQPYVMLGYIDGETVVYHAKSDRSALVNLAGSIGMLGGAAPVLIAAVGAGVLMPAIANARMAAQGVTSATQLRQIHMAAITFDRGSNGVAPTREALVEGNYISGALLHSPLGDGSEYWLDLGAMPTFDANRIVGYDRAAYTTGQAVPTLFADGHVETLDQWMLVERTQDEWNAEVEFELPW